MEHPDEDCECGAKSPPIRDLRNHTGNMNAGEVTIASFGAMKSFTPSMATSNSSLLQSKIEARLFSEADPNLGSFQQLETQLLEDMEISEQQPLHSPKTEVFGDDDMHEPGVSTQMPPPGSKNSAPMDDTPSIVGGSSVAKNVPDAFTIQHLDKRPEHADTLRRCSKENEKIPVIFRKKDGHPVGKHAAEFMTELGTAVKKFAPLQVSGWKKVTEEQKQPMFDRLEILFSVDFSRGPNSVRKETDKLMSKRYHDYRQAMHRHYKALAQLPWEERLKRMPTEYCKSEADWEFLCKLFESDTFKALPRTRYRRPILINKSGTPNTYYRIALLEEVRTTLTLFGGDELVNRFREGPFGHFIGWTPGNSNSRTLNSIFARAIFKEQGIWFHIKGQDIEYTIGDHALVTGLKFGSTDFNPCVLRNPSDSTLCRAVCNGNPPSAARLLGIFKDLSRYVDDPSGDIHLRLAYLLIIDIFILGHDAQKTPFPWLWAMVDDMETCVNFPWGAYSYKTLLYYVRTVQDDSLKYHFYGPAWALIVWGFEVLGGLGQVAGIQTAKLSYPRCLRWRFSVKLSVSNEELYNLFDDEGFQIDNISPNGSDYEREYYTSTYGEQALNVIFHKPMNPFANPTEFPFEIRRGQQGSLTLPRGDIGDMSGSRPRRSVQAKRVAEDTFNHGRSTSPPPRRRRDLGKRVRESSSSNSGEPTGSPRNPGDENDTFEERLRIFIRQTIRASENRILSEVGKWVEEIKELISRTSPRSPSSEPCRPSTPIISSGRDFGVTGTRAHTPLGASQPLLGHVGEVGARRDTSHTDSERR